MVEHPTLVGRAVRLEPLLPEHVEPLYEIGTATPEAFQFTSTPVTPEQRDAYFERAFKERDEGRALLFIMRDAVTNEIIGKTRLTDFIWRYRNCELGFTWFKPSHFGTAVNVESKYLLLRYAFEDLDLLRVYFHTDVRNERSQASIRALGARYEGTLRAHMVVKEGHIRDTMIFSIIYSEWSEVKTKLTARIEKKLSAA